MELKTLCNVKNYDAILIQEHWLCFSAFCNFDYFKNDYNIYCASAMDSEIKKGLLRGRPYGGFSVLLRKSFCNRFVSVKCISCTDRYTIIILDNLLLINVYLPCCRNSLDHNELHSIFSRIASDIEGYCYSFIIWGGDFNCNVFESSTLSDFINNNLTKFGLSVCNNFLDKPCSVEYTLLRKRAEHIQLLIIFLSVILYRILFVL